MVKLRLTHSGDIILQLLQLLCSFKQGVGDPEGFKQWLSELGIAIGTFTRSVPVHYFYGYCFLLSFALHFIPFILCINKVTICTSEFIIYSSQKLLLMLSNNIIIKKSNIPVLNVLCTNEFVLQLNTFKLLFISFFFFSDMLETDSTYYFTLLVSSYAIWGSCSHI